jgi:hypothetical protein
MKSNFRNLLTDNFIKEIDLNIILQYGHELKDEVLVLLNYRQYQV